MPADARGGQGVPGRGRVAESQPAGRSNDHPAAGGHLWTRSDSTEQRPLAGWPPIDAPSGGWLNLIHVDDAARIVLLAEQQTQPPKLYVVSDGQPVVRGDYYRELARLLPAPPPRFVEPPAGSPARERAASDKRVNPRRMFAELAPALVFPSYREGLAQIVSAGK